MIWAVVAVGLFLLSKAHASAIVGATPTGDPASSGGVPISNGQGYTQNLSTATDPGAPFSTTVAPVTVPGNAPVRGPTFYGTNLHSTAAQAFSTFLSPTILAAKRANSQTGVSAQSSLKENLLTYHKPGV